MEFPNNGTIEEEEKVEKQKREKENFRCEETKLENVWHIIKYENVNI